MTIEMKESEGEMSLFTKSKISQLRDAATAAHGKWHVGAQQLGRKRAWWERDGESLEEARIALAAAEAQPSDDEGNLRDATPERNEVTRLEGIVAKRRYEYETDLAEVKALEAVKDAATVALAEETFNVEHLGPMSKLLLEFHRCNQATAEAQTKLPSRPQFAITAINSDLIEAWTREVNTRMNPPAEREPDWNGMILFTRDWSPGRLSGKRYGIGDGAYFEPRAAADIVANGYARFQRSTPENARLTEIAKQRLAQIDRTAGFLKVGDNV
jgi:hypothetical protein